MKAPTTNKPTDPYSEFHQAKFAKLITTFVLSVNININDNSVKQCAHTVRVMPNVIKRQHFFARLMVCTAQKFDVKIEKNGKRPFRCSFAYKSAVNFNKFFVTVYCLMVHIKKINLWTPDTDVRSFFATVNIMIQCRAHILHSIQTIRIILCTHNKDSVLIFCIIKNEWRTRKTEKMVWHLNVCTVHRKCYVIVLRAQHNFEFIEYSLCHERNKYSLQFTIDDDVDDDGTVPNSILRV